MLKRSLIVASLALALGGAVSISAVRADIGDTAASSLSGCTGSACVSAASVALASVRGIPDTQARLAALAKLFAAMAAAAKANPAVAGQLSSVAASASDFAPAEPLANIVSSIAAGDTGVDTAAIDTAQADTGDTAGAGGDKDHNKDSFTTTSASRTF